LLEHYGQIFLKIAINMYVQLRNIAKKSDFFMMYLIHGYSLFYQIYYAMSIIILFYVESVN